MCSLANDIRNKSDELDKLLERTATLSRELHALMTLRDKIEIERRLRERRKPASDESRSAGGKAKR